VGTQHVHANAARAGTINAPREELASRPGAISQVDRLDVRVHGLGADPELPCDLFFRGATQQGIEDLALAASEARPVQFLLLRCPESQAFLLEYGKEVAILLGERPIPRRAVERDGRDTAVSERPHRLHVVIESARAVVVGEVLAAVPFLVVQELAPAGGYRPLAFGSARKCAKAGAQGRASLVEGRPYLCGGSVGGGGVLLDPSPAIQSKIAVDADRGHRRPDDPLNPPHKVEGLLRSAPDLARFVDQPQGLAQLFPPNQVFHGQL